MGGDSERSNKPAPAVQVTQNIGQMTGGTVTAYVNGPLHISGAGPAAPPAPGRPTPPTAPSTASVAPFIPTSEASVSPAPPIQASTPASSFSAPDKPGGGRGAPPLVVILAADTDRKLRDELGVLLRPAVDEGLLHVWHFGHIRPGDTREAVIQQHLARAGVVVVMVTATFLASPEDGARLAAVLERRRKEGLQVIPVLAGPCLWKVTALRTLEMLPSGGQSVATSTHRAVVLQQIGEAILEAALKQSESIGLPRPAPPSEGPTAMFERVVRERSPLVDMGQLSAFLERAKRQVCRIEDDTGSALGTGFLVGPDKAAHEPSRRGALSEPRGRWLEVAGTLRLCGRRSSRCHPGGSRAHVCEALLPGVEPGEPERVLGDRAVADGARFCAPGPEGSTWRGRGEGRRTRLAGSGIQRRAPTAERCRRRLPAPRGKGNASGHRCRPVGQRKPDACPLHRHDRCRLFGLSVLRPPPETRRPPPRLERHVQPGDRGHGAMGLLQGA